MIQRHFVLAGILFANHALAQNSTVEWSDLRAVRPQSCLEFLAPLEDNTDCDRQTLVAKLAERRIAACTPGNPALNGRQVKIAGYAHPLEVEFTSVRDFLLTPPLRSDCRHPSPPLPDQVIRVHFPKGIDISFDPVWVTGDLTLERTEDDNAPSSYRLDAKSVVPATLIDVNGK